MYYYVYDEFVQDPKFEREIANIETRLTDLGIQGKIARLALFRDASELIRDEIRKGTTTVVAVGSDLTLRKVIDAAADGGVAIGIIPLGGTDNFIADMLGMPQGVAACEVISARIIDELDTGVVNGRRFINHFEFTPTGKVRITCDRKFDLSPKKRAHVEIRNLAMADETVRAANPSDGKLEVVIRVNERNWFGRKTVRTTIVPVKEARIVSDEPLDVSIDGERLTAKELKIKVLPKQLKLIIGKARRF